MADASDPRCRHLKARVLDLFLAMPRSDSAARCDVDRNRNWQRLRRVATSPLKAGHRRSVAATAAAAAEPVASVAQAAAAAAAQKTEAEVRSERLRALLDELLAAGTAVAAVVESWLRGEAGAPACVWFRYSPLADTMDGGGGGGACGADGRVVAVLKRTPEGGRGAVDRREQVLCHQLLFTAFDGLPLPHEAKLVRHVYGPLLRRHTGFGAGGDAVRTRLLKRADAYSEALEVHAASPAAAAAATVAATDAEAEADNESADAEECPPMLQRLEGATLAGVLALLHTRESDGGAAAAAPPPPPLAAACALLTAGWARRVAACAAAEAPRTEAAAARGVAGEAAWWQARAVSLQGVATFLAGRRAGVVLEAGAAAAAAAGGGAAAAAAELPSAVAAAEAEAADAARYLSSLQRYEDTLRLGPPALISQALPSLLSHVALLGEVSAYYGGGSGGGGTAQEANLRRTRLSRVYGLLCDRIILTCRRHITEDEDGGEGGGVVGVGGAGARIWAQAMRGPDGCARLARKLKECDNVRATWQAACAKADGDNANAGSNPSAAAAAAAAARAPATARLELFGVRLRRIAGVAAASEEFATLGDSGLPGVSGVVGGFAEAFERLRRATGGAAAGEEADSGEAADLLDYDRAAFDAAFAAFDARVRAAEGSLRVCVSALLEEAATTDRALAILRGLEAGAPRLRGDVEAAFLAALRRHAADVDRAQRVFDAQKADPPVPRNEARAAGAVAWARHLLRRAEAPMRVFARHSALFGAHRDCRRVVRAYNRLARALTGYERLWTEAWAEAAAPAAVQAAEAPLLARGSGGSAAEGRLCVNLDPAVLALAKEATAFAALRESAVAVPAEAASLAGQAPRMRRQAAALADALATARRAEAAAAPVLRAVLRRSAAAVEAAAAPGLAALTWGSLNVDGFVATLRAAADSFEELVAATNDVAANRIKPALKAASRVVLVNLPSREGPYALDRLRQTQAGAAATRAATLAAASAAAEAAVDAVCALVEAHERRSVLPAAAAAGGKETASLPDARERARLKRHFFSMLLRAAAAAALRSLRVLRRRVDRRSGTQPPLVEVAVRPADDGSGGGGDGEAAVVSPSVEEVRSAAAGVANGVVACLEAVPAWRGVAAVASTRSSGGGYAHATVRPHVAELPEVQRALAAIVEDGGVFAGLDAKVAAFLGGFCDRRGGVCGPGAEAAFEAFVRAEPTAHCFEERLRLCSAAAEVEVPAATGAAAAAAGGGGLQQQPRTAVGCLSLDPSELLSALRAAAAAWRRRYGAELLRRTEGAVDRLLRAAAGHGEALAAEPLTLPALVALVGALERAREELAAVPLALAPVSEALRVLATPRFSLGLRTDDLRTRAAEARARWRTLRALCERRAEAAGGVRHAFRAELAAAEQRLGVEIIVFLNEYAASFSSAFTSASSSAAAAAADAADDPAEEAAAAAEAAARLQKYRSMHARKTAAWASVRDALRVYGCRPPPWQGEALARVGRDLAALARLGELREAAAAQVAACGRVRWAAARTDPAAVDAAAAACAALLARCDALPAAAKGHPACAGMAGRLSAHVRLARVVPCLAADCVLERHWRRLLGAAAATADPERLTLGDLAAAGVGDRPEAAAAAADAAAQEQRVGDALRGLAEEWEVAALEFDDWRGRGLLLLQADAVAGVTERLEEARIVLASLHPRHTEPFREEAAAWGRRLDEVDERVDVWVEVQRAWQSLEVVFSGVDIPSQMPSEARRFGAVDRQWAKLMRKARERPAVVELCCDTDVLAGLGPLRAELEALQLQLSAHLARKRAACPRFYFLADRELLDALSHGSSDPSAVQRYIPKLFDGPTAVGFRRGGGGGGGGGDAACVSELRTAEGESLALAAGGGGGGGVPCVGELEVWLSALVEAMREAVGEKLRQACGDLGGLRRGGGGGGTQPHAQQQQQHFSAEHMTYLLEAYPAQVVLVAVQVLWAEDVAGFLALPRGAERGARARELGREGAGVGGGGGRFAALLSFLVDRARGHALSGRARMTVEALVTVHEHQVAVWLAVLRGGGGPTSLEWQRQVRLRWRTDDDDGGFAVRVTFCDAEALYANEYCGPRERLVVTALTDRCYLTMSQALSMRMGGAAVGPAGTGKTETVKDLARMYGVFFVVVNCSDQMTSGAVGRLVRGLAQAGAWGCFDEFNRIEPAVLSVVAQQMGCVLTALKERAETFRFADDAPALPLRAGVGYFITMNPSYAGRHQLPESVTALFRVVSMVAPDRRQIARVRLAASGHATAPALAAKLCRLYEICELQLSPQTHYDFGLRSLLAVVRASGARLQAASRAGRRRPTAAEEAATFARALLGLNASKLVGDDAALFAGLLRDLFPAVAAAGDRTGAAVSRAVARVLEAGGMAAHEGALAKGVQLRECLGARHGVMLVGPAFSGKTAVCAALQRAVGGSGGGGGGSNGVVEEEEETAALQTLGGERARVSVARVYPKALSADELFGRLDRTTGEWQDGVFAAVWRRAAAAAQQHGAWIVCDGAVDPGWAESLNTVLDDSRVLTLASGDRLALPAGMRVLFEVGHLRDASPASVSRAGIVHFTHDDLPYRAVVFAKLFATTGAAAAAAVASPAGRAGRTQQSRLPRAVAEAVLPFYVDGEYAAPLGGGGGSGGGGSGGRGGDGGVSVVKEGALPPRSGLSPAAAAATAHYVSRYVPVPHTVEKVWRLCRREGGGGSGGGNLSQAAAGSVSLLASLVSGAAAAAAAEEEEEGVGTRRTAAVWAEATLARLFWFSLVWALGGALPEERRASFDRGVRDGVAPAAALPEAAAGLSLYDFYVDVRGGGRWVPWAERCVPAAPAAAAAGTAAGFVACASAEKVAFVAAALLAAAQPVLLVGPLGSGKTAVAGHVLRGRAADAAGTAGVRQATVVLSYASRVAALYDAVSSGANGGGHPGGSAAASGGAGSRRTLLFIDDLHTPAPPVWGSDPAVCELLRQLMAEQGFYGPTRNAFEACGGLSVLACASAASVGGGGGGGGGAATPHVASRLRARFVTLQVPYPTAPCMEALCAAWLSPVRGGCRGGPGTVADALPAATVWVWQQAAQRLLPTPMRPHYGATLRELARVCQGVAASQGAAAAAAASPEDLLAQLWRHEVSRVFADPVGERETAAWLHGVADAAAATYLPAGPAAAAAAGGAARVFTRVGVPCRTGACRAAESAGEVRCVLEGVLGAYRASGEAGTVPLDLVLFEAATAHTLRIARLLGLPGGHAMLVGVGGSGQASLSRLAAFAVDALHFRLPAARPAYGTPALLDDARRLCAAAACGRDVALAAADCDVASAEFWEVLGCLATGGDAPGLWDRDLAAREAALQEAEAASAAELAERVRRRLHLVLWVSPSGSALRTRVRRFPAVAACCCVDWFFPWPEEALVEVARARLAGASSSVGDENESEDDGGGGGEKKEAVLSLLAALHTRLSPREAAAPRVYLAFLSSYRSLHAAKRAGLRGERRRLSAGLLKLGEVEESVRGMRAGLAAQEAAIAARSAEAATQCAAVRERTKEAAAKQAEVGGVRDALESCAAEIQARRNEADGELEAALPALSAAAKAAADITQADLKELQASANNPAHLTRVVVDAVLLLLHHAVSHPVAAADLRKGGKPIGFGRGFIAPSWELRGFDFKFTNAPYGGGGRKFISHPDCVKQIMEFTQCRKDEINEETSELLDPYLELKQFTHREAWGVSHALGGLCRWVVSMHAYVRVARQVEPKMERLRALEVSLRTARLRLREKEADLAVANAARDAQRDALSAEEAAVAAMERAASAAVRRARLADRLVGDLSGERARWAARLAEAAAAAPRVRGDCAAFAAVAAYGGALGPAARAALLSGPLAGSGGLPAAVGLPVTETMRCAAGAARFAVAEEVRSRWVEEGLATDPHSVLSAAIVSEAVAATASKAPRCPLLVDPEGQGLRWLRQSCATMMLREKGEDEEDEGEEEDEGREVAGATKKKKKKEDEEDEKRLVVVCGIRDRRLRRCLQQQMERGGTLVVEGSVADNADEAALFDPVLERGLAAGGGRPVVLLPATGEEAGGAAAAATTTCVEVALHERFRLVFVTRCAGEAAALPPELRERLCVVDFSVAAAGLSDQLLSEVLRRERPEAEAERRRLVAAAAANRRRLTRLEETLLARLSAATGSLLLDDADLIRTLGDSARQTAALKAEGEAAEEAAAQLRAAAEEMAGVARRGAAVYLAAAAMRRINPMYETSLERVRDLYREAAGGCGGGGRSSRQDAAPRAAALSAAMTRRVVRFVEPGLYARDQPVFLLLVALGVQMCGGGGGGSRRGDEDEATAAASLDPARVELLLRGVQQGSVSGGGAAKGAPASSSSKPPELEFLSDAAWRAARSAADAAAKASPSAAAPPFAATVPTGLTTNAVAWRAWCGLAAPEETAPPGWGGGGGSDSAAASSSVVASEFERLVVVGCLRRDRVLPAARRFAQASLGGAGGAENASGDEGGSTAEEKGGEGGGGGGGGALGAAADAAGPLMPVVCLLAAEGGGGGGDDPSPLVVALARRRRRRLREASLGEGQDALAMAEVARCLEDGCWVLLKNCHLRLPFLRALEAELRGRRAESSGDGAAAAPHADARVWITTEALPGFPIGLLQAGVRVACEAPSGIRAGMLHAFAPAGGGRRGGRGSSGGGGDGKAAGDACAVSQELLDSFRRPDWRPAVFSVVFVHAALRERWRHGPAGFAEPCAFCGGDLAAALLTLSNHFARLGDTAAAAAATPPGWATLRYMLARVQYGGHVADPHDQRVVDAVVAAAVGPDTAGGGGGGSGGDGCLQAPEYAAPAAASAAGLTLREIRDHVERFPAEDLPSAFGLHAHAEAAHRACVAGEALRAVAGLLPAVAGAAEGGAGVVAGGVAASEEVLQGVRDGGGVGDSEIVRRAEKILLELPRWCEDEVCFFCFFFCVWGMRETLLSVL